MAGETTVSIQIGVALVLFLVLLVLWFAVPKAREVIEAAFYCAGLSWFALQLFLRFHA